MSLSPHAVFSAKPIPHLLVALSARERTQFLDCASVTGWVADTVTCTWNDNDVAVDGTWEEVLCRAQPTILLTCWSTPPLPVRWLQSRECSLQYVCHVNGSVRDLVPRFFIENGGLVTNWGAFCGPFVAEHALLLALAALRNANAWRSFISTTDAPSKCEGIGTRSLFGRSVGMHGFGSVARALVNLLRPFGITLHAFSAGVSCRMIREQGVEPCESLAELFRRSEILFECEALTPATEGSVTASVLAALRTGAVFVNVGRGRVVDESALVREAASGRIRVALDVTNEPMTPDSKLFQIPEVILSPHIGGPPHDQYRRCGELALENIERYLRGEPVAGHVTLEIYDRST